MVKSTRLKFISKILPKAHIPASNGKPLGEFPFFTSSQIQNKFLDQYIFDSEYLILGTGGVASIHYYNGKFAVSTDCIVLEIDDNYYTKFVYYFLKANQKIIDDLGFEGSGLKHLQKDFLFNLKINNMPFNKQQQISNYLDNQIIKINTIISKNKELIALLEEKRITLIKNIVTKGLNPNAPMKYSGIDWIGEIPENWQIAFLKRFAYSISSGKTKNVEEEGKYPLHGSTGVIGTTNSLDYNGTFILIARVGAYAGKTHIAKGKMGITDNTLIVDYTSKINYKFLFYILTIYDFKTLTIGSGQPLITGNDVKNIKITIPPLNEQNAIADYLDKEISKINEIMSKIDENIHLLEEYKTSLIYNSVNGKIDTKGEEI